MGIGPPEMTTDAGEELQTAGSQMESLTCCQRSWPEVAIQELSEVSPPTMQNMLGKRSWRRCWEGHLNIVNSGMGRKEIRRAPV